MGLPTLLLRQGAGGARAAAPTASRPLLQPEDAAGLIALARGLRRSASARPVARQTAGEVLSAWKGRGLDYAESRAYQAGDDLRNLHWRLMARTGRPYVKVHHEEQAAALHLLVDQRPGMAFGTRVRTKAEQAARMALLGGAAYTLAAEGATGPLTLSLWRDTVHPIALGRGLKALQRLAQALQREQVSAAPPQPTPAQPAAAGFTAWAQLLAKRLPEGSRVLLASDGAAWDAPEADAALWALCSRADVLLLQVRDPVEVALPGGAALAEADFVDLAHQQSGRLQGEAARAQFAERAARHHEARLARWRSRGLRCIDAGVDQADAAVLRALRALGG